MTVPQRQTPPIPPAPPTPGLTLKRGQKHPSPRTTNFVRTLTPEVLEETGGDEIWITGDNPETRLTRQRLMAFTAAGWTVTRYLSALRTATLTRAGRTVTVRSSSRWYGAEENPVLIQQAHARLLTLLRNLFGSWVYLWPTPTQTGQELLRGSLPFDREYPVLSPHLLERIVRNSPQGRRELTTAKDGLNAGLAKLPGLYEVDARWMYAACVRDLPTGLPQHDEISGLAVKRVADWYVPHKPGVYVVHARVPQDWHHVGLLPERLQDTTQWPWKPGYAFASACTGAELELAIKHGWVLSVHERLVWPERSSDPAKGWITKLRALRSAEDAEAARGDPAAALVSMALRRLVLDTIGGWHRVESVEEGFIPAGEPIMLPAGAVPQPREGGVAWTRRRAAISEMTHPEWSATVWGRARARLVKEALCFPPEQIIALRTDALWAASEPLYMREVEPQPGSFRVKSSYPRPVRAPRTETGIIALARKARGGVDVLEDE